MFTHVQTLISPTLHDQSYISHAYINAPLKTLSIDTITIEIGPLSIELYLLKVA